MKNSDAVTYDLPSIILNLLARITQNKKSPFFKRTSLF
jgi:hypothetical protein